MNQKRSVMKYIDINGLKRQQDSLFFVRSRNSTKIRRNSRGNLNLIVDCNSIYGVLLKK